jgi:outer membrane protein TolC
MRHALRLSLALLLASPALARAQAGGAPAIPLDEDPLDRSLVSQALAGRPELAQANAFLQADRERVPQAGALPDPVLTLGIQNDGFKSIQIGTMETSYWQVMASQTFPWFGKRGLREEAASSQARQTDASLQRARLSVEAEVHRAYLDLLLARDRLALLSKLESFWAQSEGLARTRYEAGQGAQSDLLRAQLERSRLRQKRWTLEAEERRALAALNRARARPVAEPVSTSRSLGELADPKLPLEEAAIADAEARSPELARARAAADEAGRRLALARRDYFPDFTVGAGVMPRGQLDPMWLASLSFSLPVFAGAKQSRAVAENEAREKAGAEGVDAVQRLLRLRVEERLVLLGALLQSNKLYRSGLLVQSEATVSSTMTQYRVGRVTFASVLEVLAGYVNDVDGFLESVALAQRLAIAEREVSLDTIAGPGAAMAGGAVPGAGATGGSPSGGGAAAPAAEAAGGSMSRM